MAKLLACMEMNDNLVNSGKDVCFSENINKQKTRRALGGRPAGTECGDSCTCS